jgi:GH25 family lysozyme M1 (1,4-beta-N-acetylmuramidase)
MRLLRYLQGERRGMGSELRQRKAPVVRYIADQSIAIQTQVKLADVSFWQSSIDFSKMRQGLNGVIIRAGQRNWVDSKFIENWQKARAAGIPRGSYWFYDSRDTPYNQARLWWSLIKDDKGELFHAYDLEESYGGAYGTRSHLRTFISEFQALSRLPESRLPIYTGYPWANERLRGDTFFKSYPLWQAWYSAMSNVRIPAPWTANEFLMWQYTSSGDGPFYGVGSQEIDLNWYAHDLASYRQRFGLGETTPPPTEEPMTLQYKVVWGSGVTKRTGPTTSAPSVRDAAGAPIVLPQNLIFNVAQDGIADQTYPTDPNKRWVKFPDGSYGASNYPDSDSPEVRMVNVTPPTEPPAEPVFPAEMGVTIGTVTRQYVPKA